MEKLFSSVKEFTEGMIVTGKILEVRPSEVLVDIGYKSEGVIPRYEFDDPESLKPGDEVEVLLEKIEDEDGMVVLSHDKAEQKKNWVSPSTSASRLSCPPPRSTSSLPAISTITLAKPSSSRWSRSTRTGKTSSSHAAS
jgi:transcriptional accessory protein Tex/SPT6